MGIPSALYYKGAQKSRGRADIFSVPSDIKSTYSKKNKTAYSAAPAPLEHRPPPQLNMLRVIHVLRDVATVLPLVVHRVFLEIRLVDILGSHPESLGQRD